MNSLYKLPPIFLIVLLLSSCATVHNTKSSSARSQGLLLDSGHDGKDLVITFSAFTSEQDKSNSLNSSAQIKASQICPGGSYKLVNVYSTPANISASWATARISGISANIQCGNTEYRTASTPIPQTGVIKTEYCQNLLQTNIYRWTGECSVKTGTGSGSQIEKPQLIKYSNQAEVDLNIKKLPKSNLPKCAGEVSLLWASSNIYTDWTNCIGTLIYSRSETLSSSTYKEEKYTGMFRGGKADGFGVYFYDSGNVYIGQFQNGQSHGQGILIAIDPKLNKEGIWESNLFKYSQKINFQSVNTAETDPKLKPPEINKAQALNKVESTPVLAIAAVPVTQTSVIPASISLMNPGKRVALVIGNASYKLHPLDNPKNDADDMSKALRSTGFEVIDIRDASLAQMRSAVRQFGDKLLTKDVGLVYYSGHGMEVKGRNYFIPVNADIKRSDEVADQSLDVGLILDKMETAKKGVNILIVDACRDDPFGRSFRSGNRGLATMDAPQGTIIAFATSPGKVAADGIGRNSPYTKNLIKVMQVPNLPIEQVFKNVRRAVQEETKNQQTPWENTSLSGDFYFSVKK